MISKFNNSNMGTLVRVSGVEVGTDVVCFFAECKEGFGGKMFFYLVMTDEHKFYKAFVIYKNKDEMSKDFARYSEVELNEEELKTVSEHLHGMMA